MLMTFTEAIYYTTGYQCMTTFPMDFAIAETMYRNKKDRDAAIRDTYKRSFESFKDDVKYFTELVLVLNWKIWQYYEKDPALGKLYDTLWRKADRYGSAHFTGADANYYFTTLD